MWRILHYSMVQLGALRRHDLVVQFVSRSGYIGLIETPQLAMCLLVQFARRRWIALASAPCPLQGCHVARLPGGSLVSVGVLLITADLHWGIHLSVLVRLRLCEFGACCSLWFWASCPW